MVRPIVEPVVVDRHALVITLHVSFVVTFDAANITFPVATVPFDATITFEATTVTFDTTTVTFDVLQVPHVQLPDGVAGFLHHAAVLDDEAAGGGGGVIEEPPLARVGAAEGQLLVQLEGEVFLALLPVVLNEVRQHHHLGTGGELFLEWFLEES